MKNRKLAKKLKQTKIKVPLIKHKKNRQVEKIETDDSE